MYRPLNDVPQRLLMSIPDLTDGSDEGRELGDLINRISSQSFSDWYQQREYTKNIREGQPYFNGSDSVQEPRTHSPSKFLQCHRKTYYHQLNAAQENQDPTGIFWFGTKFETDLIVPYLQDMVGDRRYVQNSKWVDFTVDSEQGEIRIRGETDPTIVDSEGKPWAVTEIKSKQSIGRLESPDERHLAQVHAYMYGLSEKFEDRKIADAIILYGSRDSLDVKTFHVEFDPWFWRERVLNWASTHTEFRLNERLPPASPEQSWECDYCPYKERCGKGDHAGGDSPPRGFLPLTVYPRTKIIEHLQAHPDEVALTPTLAHEYPDLAEIVDVHDWFCVSCNERSAWDETDWDGRVDDPPACDECGVPGALRGPNPSTRSSGSEP